MNLQNMKRSETTEQIRLFNWANNNLTALPSVIRLQAYKKIIWY